MAELFGFDAYSPKEIAERVENIGVTKARLPLLTVATLGVLAGGFIGLGALYFTLVTSDSSLSFAASRLLGGLTFSLGRSAGFSPPSSVHSRDVNQRPAAARVHSGWGAGPRAD